MIFGKTTIESIPPSVYQIKIITMKANNFEGHPFETKCKDIQLIILHILKPKGLHFRTIFYK